MQIFWTDFGVSFETPYPIERKTGLEPATLSLEG